MIALKIILITLAAVVGLFLLYVIFLEVCSLLVNTKKEYTHVNKFYYSLLMSGTALTVFGTNSRIKTEGLDKLPDGNFLLVSNHRSNFDPIFQWWALRKKIDCIFVSKGSNFKVPFFGRIIRKCGFLEIDRDNAKQSMLTLIKAADFLKKEKVAVGIYPEGTRNKDSQSGLLPFHNGVFKIAQMAKVPIVVMSVAGTENVHTNFLKRHTDITLSVVDVISAEEITGVKTTEIGERVANALNEKLYS